MGKTPWLALKLINARTITILIPAFPAVSLVELIIVFTTAALAYFAVFNNFEKHLLISKRVVKLFVLVGILSVVGTLFDRYVYWGLIGLMTIGQIILHG